MRRPARSPGFTLIEAALALGLALALVAAMLAFYDQLLDVRAAVTDEMAVLRDERMIMGRITDDLRSGLPLAGGLRGGEAWVRMTTSDLPGPAVWAVPDVTDDPLPAEQDLRLVGYRLRIEENEDGDPVVTGLERTVQRLLGAPAPEEGVDVDVTLVSEHFRFLALRYWDGSGWVPDWGGGDVPAAVEVVLGTEPLPEETEPEDYPFETFRRVVFMLAGERPPEGTVVRGLEEGGP